MDILAALEVAEAAFKLGVTFSDAMTLYQLYMIVKTAGKVDFITLAKSAALPAEIDAIARVSTVFSTLLKDKVQGPRALALLASLG